MTQGGEEAAEMISTIRGEHVAMKTWFNGTNPTAVALRSKWGDYPGLWKEVLNWKGWKEARKAYLADQQRNEMLSNSNAAGNGTANTSTTSPGTQIPIKMENSTPSDNSRTTSDGDAAVPRKRKSRWGSAASDEQPRKSRWETPAAPPVGSTFQSNAAGNAAVSVPLPSLPSRNQPSLPGLPGMPANLTPQQQQEMAKYQARLREVNDKLQIVEREAARVDSLPRGHRERSPSPPPVYGPDGKRKNTRAVRWRERYTAERQDLLEKLMSLNPSTRHNSLFRRKRTNKVPIPIEQHPNYNFIGLIIGPRGKTQKELESKTGCKIAIRGKGSVKEGARGRRDGKMMEGDDEPLHVVITGEDQGSVDAATDMIHQMLVVIDDEKNVHKQSQLRELALLNGTLKEEEFCQICAEKGHRAFECPKRFSNKTKIQVRCAICGDTSHPTRDCTQKATPELEGGKNKQELDSDYANFMAELDGKKVEAKKPDLPPVTPAAAVPPAAYSEPVGLTIIKPAVPVPVPVGGPPPPVPIPPPPAMLPPPPGFSALAPPPPPNLPPPPPVQYGGYPPPPQQQQHAPPAAFIQQQGYDGYYPQQGGHPQQHQHPDYQHGHQQGYHQGQPPNQPAKHQEPHDETEGWDYKSYYGQQSSGAGGFNWWDQN